MRVLQTAHVRRTQRSHLSHIITITFRIQAIAIHRHIHIRTRIQLRRMERIVVGTVLVLIATRVCITQRRIQTITEIRIRIIRINIRTLHILRTIIQQVLIPITAINC